MNDNSGGGGGSGGAVKITSCTLTTGLDASLQAKGGVGGGGSPDSEFGFSKMIFSVHLFTDSRPPFHFLHLNKSLL